MNDFDELLTAKLAFAIENARNSGRDDIAEYLALKAANDSIRQKETDDLLKAFIGVALSGKNAERKIEVEREEPHSFPYGNANMQGKLLRITRGLRCLTVETGWTRAPGDGVMRMGAMAAARLVHFGIPERNSELILKASGEGHSWFEIKQGLAADPFGPEGVERHLAILFSDKVR